MGVDIAPGMLAVAGAAAPPNVVLARMDVELLAFADGYHFQLESGATKVTRFHR